MEELSIGKKILIYTNPIGLIIGLGMLLSALLYSLFKDTHKNMKKILKEE